ncbi:MAG: cation transporter [Oribacterium sp.]|nr:cation transporter [Oribacterium sp.]
MVKTTLKIEGMACEMCEAHINDVIRKTVKDAKKISSSHKKGSCSFVSEEEPDIAALKAAIAGTGYECKEAVSEEYVNERKGLFGLFK